MVAVPLSAPFQQDQDQDQQEQGFQQPSFSIFDGEDQGHAAEGAAGESEIFADGLLGHDDQEAGPAGAVDQVSLQHSEPAPSLPTAPLAETILGGLAQGGAETTNEPAKSVSVVLCHFNPASGQWSPMPEGATAEIELHPSPLATADEKVALIEEMDRERRIADAEQEYMKAAMAADEIEAEIADLKEALKAAKELRGTCYDRLRRLKADIGDPDGDTEIDEEEADKEEESEAGGGRGSAAGVSTGSHVTTPPPASDSSDDWWKTTALRDVISGIKGCGEKKLDAICDKLPTLGDLVALQERAGGYGIHEEMPKGVGKALCEAIEEKVLQWLTANRDKFGEPASPEPLVFDTAKFIADFDKAIQSEISMEAAGTEGSLPSMAADGSSPTGGEEIASRPESPPQDHSNGLVANDVAGGDGNAAQAPPAAKDSSHFDDLDSIHAAQIKSRLATLRKREASELKPTSQDIYSDGRAAAHASEGEPPWDACNWIAGPQQDDWLLGWLSVQG